MPATSDSLTLTIDLEAPGRQVGDEFEGLSTIMRLVATLDPKDISGQILFLPAFNTPAVAASSRVSPLDGENLNRAFPGDGLGGPTAKEN